MYEWRFRIMLATGALLSSCGVPVDEVQFDGTSPQVISTVAIPTSADVTSTIPAPTIVDLTVPPSFAEASGTSELAPVTPPTTRLASPAPASSTRAPISNTPVSSTSVELPPVTTSPEIGGGGETAGPTDPMAALLSSGFGPLPWGSAFEPSVAYVTELLGEPTYREFGQQPSWGIDHTMLAGESWFASHAQLGAEVCWKQLCLQFDAGDSPTLAAWTYLARSQGLTTVTGLGMGDPVGTHPVTMVSGCYTTGIGITDDGVTVEVMSLNDHLFGQDSQPPYDPDATEVRFMFAGELPPPSHPSDC